MILNSTFEVGQRAVLEATYSDFKLIKTRKVISLCFEVPIEQADLVHQVLGMPNPAEEKWVAIARLSCTEKSYNSEVAEKPKKGEYGDYSRKLYTSGFFLHPEVCEALGTDEEFRKWIQTQKSCVSGKQDYIGMESGEMKCEASHVERVHAGHGKGIKAPYCCVPLTHEEHQTRHRHGEVALVTWLSRGENDEINHRPTSVEDAKAWFWEQRCKKVTEWGKMRLKEKILSPSGFKYESLADMPPPVIKLWAQANNLTNFLPTMPRE